MPRSPNARQIVIVVSEEEHTNIKRLAGALSVASYTRNLYAEDAARRGEEWTTQTPEIGALGAGRRAQNKETS